MNIVPVNLAVEDELSEAVLRAILSQLRGYAVGVAYRRGGSGYLRRTIRGFNNAARGTPYVVLADFGPLSMPSRSHPRLALSPTTPESGVPRRSQGSGGVAPRPPERSGIFSRDTREIDSTRCGRSGRPETDLDRPGSKIQVPGTARRHSAPP